LALNYFPLAWNRWLEFRCPGKRLAHYGLGFFREGLEGLRRINPADSDAGRNLLRADDAKRSATKRRFLEGEL
jgi:hypothetical protein